MDFPFLSFFLFFLFSSFLLFLCSSFLLFLFSSFLLFLLFLFSFFLLFLFTFFLDCGGNIQSFLPSVCSPHSQVFIIPFFVSPSLLFSLPSLLFAPPKTCSFLPSFLPSSLPSSLPSFLPPFLPPFLPSSFLPSSLPPSLPPSFLPSFLPSSLLPPSLPPFLPPFLPPPSLPLSLPSSLSLLPSSLPYLFSGYYRVHPYPHEAQQQQQRLLSHDVFSVFRGHQSKAVPIINGSYNNNNNNNNNKVSRSLLSFFLSFFVCALTLLLHDAFSVFRGHSCNLFQGGRNDEALGRRLESIYYIPPLRRKGREEQMIKRSDHNGVRFLLLQE